MESPGQNGGIEAMMSAFIEKHPEYKEKNFTQGEIHQAAELIKARDANVAENMLQRALDARLAVRGVGERKPVTDDTDTVVDMARSAEEAKINMFRRNNEAGTSL